MNVRLIVCDIDNTLVEKHQPLTKRTREAILALKEKGVLLKPRFSAGYGDLPLTVQREIFSQLNPDRKIGLTLNESLLMSPSKSVTAFAGIEAGVII